MARRYSGRIQFSKVDVQNYLKKNGLSLTYLILNQSWITLIGRQMLFAEKAQHYRNYVSNYDFAEENISYDIVKMQLMLLDLLSSIFMSLEDYLGHSHHLRLSLGDFSKQIASKNWKVTENEIDYLKSLTKKDISKYLLLPDVSKLNVDYNDIKIVKKNFRNITQIVYKKMRQLLKFYKRYYRVYTKYKHILPAVLGLYARNYNLENIQDKDIVTSNIYIRDRVYVKNKKNRKYKYNTYVILSSGLQSLTYYEQIMEDIKSIFNLLALSYINSMSNLGKPFIIPANDYIKEEEWFQWEKILKKVNTTSVISPNLEVSLNFVEPLRGKLGTYLPKNTIYKLERDLLSGSK